MQCIQECNGFKHMGLDDTSPRAIKDITAVRNVRCNDIAQKRTNIANWISSTKFKFTAITNI
jgi:hypothetical protein